MNDATRRRFLAVSCVGAVTGLAGCSSDGSETDTAPTSTDGETATETTVDGGEPPAEATRAPVTVSGRLVDTDGEAVTVGQAISLGEPEELVAVAPDAEGRFELALTGGYPYTFQYTQGAYDYPADGLPDLYTIGQDNPTADTDLGTIELPEAYAVDLSVETADGDDVTVDALVSVSHAANDASSGFELRHNPAELTGTVALEVTYDGAQTTEIVDITEPQSVTVTVA